MDILDIKNIVRDLSERDAKTFLFHILLKIGQLEDEDYSLVEFSNDLKEIYDQILYPEDSNPNDDQYRNYKKVHINFGYPYLRHALNELNIHKEEVVISFSDNFAIGPLGNLDDENGQIARHHWLKQNIKTIEEFEDYLEEFQSAINQINSIPNDIPIYIWISENAHEQTGLLFVMYLLRERKNSISIINSAEFYRELFKQKAKKYIPFFSGGIILEEIMVIYKYSQDNQKNLTNIEKRHLESQWVYLSARDETLRVWVNKAIERVSEDYFDELIIRMAKKLLGKKRNGYIPSMRLVGEVYGRTFQYVGDDFLEYRLRKLIEKGIFEFEGNLEAMQNYRVKLSN